MGTVGREGRKRALAEVCGMEGWLDLARPGRMGSEDGRRGKHDTCEEGRDDTGVT